jgi:hypothetical protein
MPRPRLDQVADALGQLDAARLAQQRRPEPVGERLRECRLSGAVDALDGDQHS